VLSLVPAADGLHWLVRRVDDAPPGEGVSAAP